MASGDTLCVFTPAANEPPAANFAVLDVENSELEIDFLNGVTEAAVFRGVLPRNYAGGGVTVTVHYSSSGTSGNIVFGASFERNQDSVSSLASDNWGTEETVTAVAPATTWFKQSCTINFTNGSQMASIAVGETFRMRLRRITGGSDTLAAIAAVYAVEIKES